MVETELRFKVVLAGLHNVQRSTRVANNPLAHYGSPICIGPLLGNGEAREAENLIRRPLSALGIFFEDSSLPIRILAQTNYYPNLIQIYCQSLLRHITEKQGFQIPEETPPYIVTSEDIDDVYERQELRYELREKFRLTLDLDRRFSLIAHLLAFNEVDYPDGMFAEEIRRDALGWWPEGFRVNAGLPRSIPQDAFRDLLEEMVGLGILRRTKDEQRYGLRSPNVSAMLGTPRQIEDVIDGAEHWELPAEYEPQAFRSRVTRDDPWLRSPLTAAQEGEIRTGTGNIVVVVGAPAAGLHDVPSALSNSFGADYVNQLGTAATLEDFALAMSALSHRLKSGKTLLVIPSESPWDVEWVEVASKRMRRFSRSDAQVGAVFTCGPEKLWQMRSVWPKVEEFSTAVLNLHPWADQALRQWFEDSPLGPQTKQNREEVSRVTGNWPALVQELSRHLQEGEPLQQAIAAVGQTLSESGKASDLCSSFGLDVKATVPILLVLAEYGDAVSDWELVDLAGIEDDGDTFDRELASEAMHWADKLDLVTQTQRGWQLDRVVGESIRFVSKD